MTIKKYFEDRVEAIKILHRVSEHFNEAHNYFNDNQIVGIFLQGSQNYWLQTPNSDVDTKLIVTPTFEQIALNKNPVSTTHVRANDEHIDFKDIRLYMKTFEKQNLNFVEILFTPYKILNPLYETEWKRLVDEREAIAHMNPCRAVKSMMGVAMEKWHAMEHEYPSKLEILSKYGYDPKQLHHLLRIEDFLSRYIEGELYENCMIPLKPEYLVEVKQGMYDLEKARTLGAAALEHITDMTNWFCATQSSEVDQKALDLLTSVQLNIMRIAIGEELWNE